MTLERDRGALPTRRGRLLQGVTVYAACIGFSLAVYTGMVWLYLDHPVWFALTTIALVGLVVAVCWDDIFYQQPEPVDEQPARLRSVA